MVSPDEIQDEQMRMRQVRLLVDLTSYRLRYGAMSREDAMATIEDAREVIMELCPNKGDVFDLVLRPRFLRFLDERTMAEWGVMDSIN
ncbi:MAG TPA: hypothetical protein VJ692_02350 [Nitrospiraceae bacterium]|nr:hypothetical protein [Nitrospiraceae bacterium]